MNYKSYNITNAQTEELEELITSGAIDEAIDLFLYEKVILPSRDYTGEMQQHLYKTEKGILTEKQFTNIRKKIAMSSITFGNTLAGNMNVFIKMFGKYIFKQNKITNPEVKKAIFDATLEQFNSLTKDSMRRTQTEMRVLIRNMQQEHIIFNQRIHKQGLTGELLDKEVELFKQTLKKKLPSFYEAMENGNILKTKTGRTYKLDYYTEMSTRNTVLNVDRTAVETTARIDDINYLIFYLRDHRPLKSEEREICKHVLRKKINGESLVALNKKTAYTLHIPLMDNIKAEGSFGVNCRHSVKIPSKSFQKEVNIKYRL